MPDFMEVGDKIAYYEDEGEIVGIRQFIADRKMYYEVKVRVDPNGFYDFIKDNCKYDTPHPENKLLLRQRF